MATPASHHDTSTPPVAACALPSSTNAVTPWKQEGIPLGKVRHPLDLPLLDPKYSNTILLSQVGGSIFNGILFSNWIVNELSVSGQSIVVAKVGPCNFVLVGVALD